MKHRKKFDIPPDWLDATGRAYWTRIAPPLYEAGKLDGSSYDLVAAACKAYSAYREAVKTLDDEGRVITSHTGARKTHPALAVEKQSFEMLCRVFRELRISDKPPALPENELTEFLEG